MIHRSLSALVVAALLVVGLITSRPAAAIELGPRRIEVSANVDIKGALKIGQELLKFNDAGTAPIYLLIVTSGGTAQGVMMLADAIRSIDSPVVAVVLTPVAGAGAALALAADQVVMLPSAELHLTDVEYEGIPKKDPPKPDATPPEEPAAATQRVFQQKVRSDYLARFWAFVGKRAGESGPALQQKVEGQGGVVITAQEALKKKIVAEVVAKIEQSRLVNEKTEVKAISTRNLVRTAPAPTEGVEVR
jgi:membrane-bound ClpP family serine protease